MHFLVIVRGEVHAQERDLLIVVVHVDLRLGIGIAPALDHEADKGWVANVLMDGARLNAVHLSACPPRRLRGVALMNSNSRRRTWLPCRTELKYLRQVSSGRSSRASSTDRMASFT